MRRLCLPLTVLAALAVGVGCEDGPNQTFSPAPGTAASSWNSGSPDAAFGQGTQQYDAGYPTGTKTDICGPDLKRQRWAWMLSQPVQPPRFYAGLDMAKNDQWDGLKIDDAELPPPNGDPNAPGGGLCQSNPFGFQGTCPSGFDGCNLNTWGNASEVQFSWNVATHFVDQMILNLGYTGQIKTDKYFDHKGEEHAYTIGVGDVIRRDGQPYLIQWTDLATAKIQITDIFNAIMATFSQKAGVPFDTSTCKQDSDCNAPGTVSICECAHDPNTAGVCKAGSSGKCGVKNCGSDGNCLVYNDGSSTIFGIRPMVVYISGTAGVPQPALSTPVNFYNFFSKWEPFSNLGQILKLDKDGPLASGTPIGIPKGATTVCKQQVGTTFGDFQKNCVQVHGDSQNPNGVDQVNLNKVVHSLSHDQEHWTANVLGVNQNFTSIRVLNDPNAVVLDTDQPQPNDIAQDWTFDIRARGKPSNDYTAAADGTPGKGPPDWRGSELLFIEWARLLQQDMARILHARDASIPATPHTLGDPACTGFTASGVPNYQLTKGCTGIEGLILPAPTGAAADFSKDPVPAGQLLGAAAQNNLDVNGAFYGKSALQPSDLHGGLCLDPGGFTDCTADNVSIWQNMLHHVSRVLGGGVLTNLPSEFQDRRYYFRWFGVAYVKYLKAYGNYVAKYGQAKADSVPTGTVGSGLAPSDVISTDIDIESLFFDFLSQPGSGAAQTFDKFEYVDRDFTGQGNGGAYNWIPWDFEYGCDLFGGNQRYDNWFRRMDREEIAMFSAMLEDKTQTPGSQNNVNVTNMFGSILLGGDSLAGVSGAFPSYACAIGAAGDPAINCGGAYPPLEPNPTSTPACGAGGSCASGRACKGGPSYEAGVVQFCGLTCDFTAHPQSGCAAANQACVGRTADKTGTITDPGACLEMKMDRNVPGSKYARPLLARYPGVWSRTPFGRGHSPITIANADKHPEIGVAKVTIPNFKAGPYTFSPVVPDMSSGMAKCATGFTLSANGAWCNAALNAGQGTLAPSFSALTPWTERQPGIGFRIALDGAHDQFVNAGQFDYRGVLENYIVDYAPYVDKAKPSCVADATCNKGFVCNVNSDCVTDDNTVSVLAIEGSDFLGEAFMCQDPFTADILHVRMYDSAQSIIDWFANHPGSQNGGQGSGGSAPSAQNACQIVIRRTSYDTSIDSITSKSNGVYINVSGGQGQGRVTDVILFDPGLIQSL